MDSMSDNTCISGVFTVCQQFDSIVTNRSAIDTMFRRNASLLGTIRYMYTSVRMQELQKSREIIPLEQIVFNFHFLFPSCLSV